MEFSLGVQKQGASTSQLYQREIHIVNVRVTDWTIPISMLFSLLSFSLLSFYTSLSSIQYDIYVLGCINGWIMHFHPALDIKSCCQ